MMVQRILFCNMTEVNNWVHYKISANRYFNLLKIDKPTTVKIIPVK